MSKVHLYASESPLRQKASSITACGEVLARPLVVWTWEGDLRDVSDIGMLGTCKKCAVAEIVGRYVYGVIDSR